MLAGPMWRLFHSSPVRRTHTNRSRASISIEIYYDIVDVKGPSEAWRSIVDGVAGLKRKR